MCLPGMYHKKTDMCILGDSEHTDELTTFTRVSALSTKLRQRMYKRAMRDLRGLQVRSQERLQKLHFTVDLVCIVKISKIGTSERIAVIILKFGRLKELL